MYIGRDEQHNPRIVLLGDAALRDRLSQAARFFRAKEIQGEIEITIVSPPREISQVLLTRHNWNIPALRGITEIPVLRPDGSVLTTPGYDAASQLHYIPAQGLQVPRISEAPTQQEVYDAMAFLQNELLADFPFVQNDNGISASRANALGLLLTPIVRTLFEGLVPLALLDKPQQGTGASLYAEVVSIIATGRPAAMMSAPNRDEEWRKRITSVLAAGARMICIDNVDGVLDAPSLGAVLTARVWSDRVLGHSKTITIPHQATWMATGNNIIVRGDLPRRCYWIRMNARTARPWQRQDFKNPNLLSWVAEYRGDIVAKLLTIARGWVVAERPMVQVPPLGNFTAWAQTVGSILAHAGVEGFLENLHHLYTKMDPDLAEWSAFLQIWYQVYGSQGLVLSTVVADLRSNGAAYQALREALPEDFVADLHVRGGKDPERLARRLGNAFKKLHDRYFEDGLHVEKIGQEHRATKWRVVQEDNGNDNPDKSDRDDDRQRNVCIQDSPDSQTDYKNLKNGVLEDKDVTPQTHSLLGTGQ